jgi:hypothetical protein
LGLMSLGQKTLIPETRWGPQILMGQFSLAGSSQQQGSEQNALQAELPAIGVIPFVNGVGATAAAARADGKGLVTQ